MLPAHNFRIGYISAVKSWFLPCLTAGSLALALKSAPAQNLITNGDFETPPFAPSLMITGWDIQGTGQIHSIEEGSTTPSHSAAFNVSGSSEGSILSQSFSTVVGQLRARPRFRYLWKPGWDQLDDVKHQGRWKLESH